MNSFLVSTSQINEFVKRARAAKIHAYIISHLKKEMPAMMGKAKAQQRLIDNLEDEFGKVAPLSPSSLCLFFPKVSNVLTGRVMLIVNLLELWITGSKGVPPTRGRLPKCGAF